MSIETGLARFFHSICDVMAARAMVVHYQRSCAGMIDMRERCLSHHAGKLGLGIGRIPMHVVGDMAMAVMPAQAVPILLVPIVVARVLPVNGRLGRSVRPNRGDLMLGLDPAAEARQVLQARCA